MVRGRGERAPAMTAAAKMADESLRAGAGEEFRAAVVSAARGSSPVLYVLGALEVAPGSSGGWVAWRWRLGKVFVFGLAGSGLTAVIMTLSRI